MADAKGRGPSRASTFAKDIFLVALVLVVATGLAFAVTSMNRPPTPQAAYNFSLSVHPTSGTVAPGDVVTTTVAATVTSGTAGSLEVRFSCKDLPSGATCTFTPSSCRPTCSAVELVLSTSPTTPTGTYLVSIVASNETISRTATFAITVSAPPPPPFDFSLEVHPASGTVAPGGRVSANVTASLSSRASQTVRFSCSGVPPETTCDFVPQSCRTTCNVTLTLVTSASTTLGTYSIDVTASHGSLSRTVPYVHVDEVAARIATQPADAIKAHGEGDEILLGHAGDIEVGRHVTRMIGTLGATSRRIVEGVAITRIHNDLAPEPAFELPDHEAQLG